MTSEGEDADISSFFEQAEAAMDAVFVPQSVRDYSNPHYWKRRYEADQSRSYDWYDLDFHLFWDAALRKAPALEAAEQLPSRDSILHHVQQPDPGVALQGPDEVHHGLMGSTVSGQQSVVSSRSQGASLRPLVNARGQRQLLALEIGAGNSEWSARMAEKGVTVISTDIDHGVLGSMRQHSEAHESSPLPTSHEPGCGVGRGIVERAAVDATALPFRHGVFDFVVEKGTLDALFCMSTDKSSSMGVLPNRILLGLQGPPQAASTEAILCLTNTDAATQVLGRVAVAVYQCLDLAGSWYVVTAKDPWELLGAAGALHAVPQSLKALGNSSESSTKPSTQERIDPITRTFWATKLAFCNGASVVRLIKHFSSLYCPLFEENEQLND